MTKVVVKEGEPIEVCLRRFRRSIQSAGLIADLRARQAYEKPTAERKRKKAAARSRTRKRLMRETLPPKLY
ncbi:30S ribosomal protein S21 [Chitinasiproducens palmae]|uniref:Small ribosomal subunit protein bS21 n=1 Tax=Chitinasiproducens palmae TaxID=1770053 RepID=A0A1H2PUX9_9BURK|nr:30S ribosomal protein S21 [Chitinasiproducens palmae]SDV51040.1 SSU ribosomal protein S21P [Chitinasiproducens palmae]